MLNLSRYYLTSTTWTDVRITAASTIEGLKTAESRVIWSDRSNPARACNFWAPEMHKVDDRWYVYFSASLCNSDWGIVLPSLRVYALAGGSENPLSAAYTISDPIVPPNYNAGMLDAVCDKVPSTPGKSLTKDHQTLFDIEGTTYFLASS